MFGWENEVYIYGLLNAMDKYERKDDIVSKEKSWIKVGCRAYNGNQIH